MGICACVFKCPADRNSLLRVPPPGSSTLLPPGSSTSLGLPPPRSSTPLGVPPPGPASGVPLLWEFHLLRVPPPCDFHLLGIPSPPPPPPPPPSSSVLLPPPPPSVWLHSPQGGEEAFCIGTKYEGKGWWCPPPWWSALCIFPFSKPLTP